MFVGFVVLLSLVRLLEGVEAEIGKISWLNEYSLLLSEVEKDSNLTFAIIQQRSKVDCFILEEFTTQFSDLLHLPLNSNGGFYYYLSFFNENTSDLLLHSQDLFHFLLQKNIKIDLECLTQLGSLRNLSSEERLLFIINCAVIRSIEDNRSDLVVLFIDDESCQLHSSESFSFYRIPSSQLSIVKDKIQIKLRYQPTLFSSFDLTTSSDSTPTPIDLETWIRDYQHFSNAHRNRFCNFWWPLNFTDIILPKNNVNEIKQHYMLQCDLPPEYTADRLLDPSSTFNLIVIVHDYWNHSCDSCYRSIQVTVNVNILIDGKFLPSLPTVGYRLIPINGDVTLFPLKENQTHKKLIFQLYLEEIRNHQESNETLSESIAIGEFSLLLNAVSYKVPPTSFRFPTSFREEENQQLSHKYSLLSLVAMRDDFGMLFSVLFAQQKSFSMVEIGVLRGVFAERIVRTSSLLATYIGIDTWNARQVYGYTDTTNTQTEQHHEENYQQAIDRMNRSSSIFPSSISTRKLLIREDASKAVHLFPNQSIDVVYIDAMHDYTSVVKDILTWYPKVKVGGIIAGHDFYLGIFHETMLSVQPAVEKFAQEKGLVLFTTKEEPPSWILMKTYS